MRKKKTIYQKFLSDVTAFLSPAFTALRLFPSSSRSATIFPTAAAASSSSKEGSSSLSNGAKKMKVSSAVANTNADSVTITGTMAADEGNNKRRDRNGDKNGDRDEDERTSVRIIASDSISDRSTSLFRAPIDSPESLQSIEVKQDTRHHLTLSAISDDRGEDDSTHRLFDSSEQSKTTRQRSPMPFSFSFSPH